MTVSLMLKTMTLVFVGYAPDGAALWAVAGEPRSVFPGFDT